MRQQLPWPVDYNFGRFVCKSDKGDGAIVRQGTWRIVVPVIVEGEADVFVAKVLRDPPQLNRFIKFGVDAFRRFTALDENSREWRFLKKHSKNPKLADLLPNPLARGVVDGKKAILVQRVTWEGQQLNMTQFVQQATREQKLQLKACIDEIIDFFGRFHVVCNDINASNMMVSDKNGTLSIVVIDGFGNNHLIPYPIFSKTLNARKVARRLNRTKQRLGIN